jgi:hypothetical protein
MTLREQLMPLIRSVGVVKSATAAGISPSILSEWLAGKIPAGSSRPRRLADDQLERLCAALGHSVRVESIATPRRRTPKLLITLSRKED